MILLPVPELSQYFHINLYCLYLAFLHYSRSASYLEIYYIPKIPQEKQTNDLLEIQLCTFEQKILISFSECFAISNKVAMISSEALNTPSWGYQITLIFQLPKHFHQRERTRRWKLILQFLCSVENDSLEKSREVKHIVGNLKGATVSAPCRIFTPKLIA